MSETKLLVVEAVEISDVKGLDPIQVFWQDFGNGRGSATITCYGCAWTVYFGAMGDTIRGFFARADVDYLVNKMGNNHPLKQSKRADAYLAKIVQVIKDVLAEGKA